MAPLGKSAAIVTLFVVLAASLASGAGAEDAVGLASREAGPEDAAQTVPAAAEARVTTASLPLIRGDQAPARAPGSAVPAALRSLRTRPERTNYEETSRYDDVIAFMETVANAAPGLVHLTSFGYSFEARRLPLAVVGTVKDASPEAVKASGKVRVYLQGNIHADEVEGKEACLELLRALASGRHAAWLDSAILLIGPIYNADGNDAIAVRNRYNSPVGGMGQRANRQVPVNMDLNRDFMKLDSPEARSFAMLMTRYDPHIFVDLHTTNGSTHAYHLTYAPPLHPATPSVLTDLARKELLPAVTKAIKQKHGWDYYFYGNFGRGAEQGALRAWQTTEPGLRYGTNYVGMRNRIGILSETYSYLLFKDRIAAARAFIEEVCAFAAANAAEIRSAADEADRQRIVAQTVALTGKAVRSQQPVDILVGEVTTVRHPYTGGRLRVRADVSKPEKMFEYTWFEADETVRAPQAYLVPPGLDVVADRLEAHGIQFSRLTAPASFTLERFRIVSSTLAERDYQGHRARSYTGAWEAAEQTLPAGTLVVPVDQPLGRLLVQLLEPRAPDSLGAWNLLDEAPAMGPGGGPGGGPGFGRPPAPPQPQQEKERPPFYQILRTHQPVAGSR